MEDDLTANIKLRNLVMNMKKEVCGVIDHFFSFLTKYDEMKAHNMLSLMLDSKYKILRLISSFIGCEQGVLPIVEKYDRRSMFPMLLKSYHHLLSIIREWKLFS